MKKKADKSKIQSNNLYTNNSLAEFKCSVKTICCFNEVNYE